MTFQNCIQNSFNSTFTSLRSHRCPLLPCQRVYTMIDSNSWRTYILNRILALFSCHANLHDLFLDVLYDPSRGVFLRTRHRTLSARPSANDSRKKMWWDHPLSPDSRTLFKRQWEECLPQQSSLLYFITLFYSCFKINIIFFCLLQE